MCAEMTTCFTCTPVLLVHKWKWQIFDSTVVSVTNRRWFLRFSVALRHADDSGACECVCVCVAQCRMLDEVTSRYSLVRKHVSWWKARRFPWERGPRPSVHIWNGADGWNDRIRGRRRAKPYGRYNSFRGGHYCLKLKNIATSFQATHAALSLSLLLYHPSISQSTTPRPLLLLTPILPLPIPLVISCKGVRTAFQSPSLSRSPLFYSSNHVHRSFTVCSRQGKVKNIIFVCQQTRRKRAVYVKRVYIFCEIFTTLWRLWLI